MTSDLQTSTLLLDNVQTLKKLNLSSGNVTFDYRDYNTGWYYWLAETDAVTKSQTQPPAAWLWHKIFLTQILTDLHQTFRISSWSSINMIHDVKDDPILQSGALNVLQVANVG